MAPRPLPVAQMLQKGVRPPNAKSWTPSTASHSQLEMKAAGTAGDSPKESAAAWEQAMDSLALVVLKTQLDKAVNNTVSSQLCCEQEVSWTRDLQRSLPT